MDDKEVEEWVVDMKISEEDKDEKKEIKKYEKLKEIVNVLESKNDDIEE